ncbi:MAG: hypothetical protein AAGD22_00055 [Verrucomicrobiota bacterium]
MVLVFVCASEPRSIDPGGAAYWGTIFLIAAMGFIAGVVSCFAWTTEMITHYPSSENRFWEAAFEKQVSLLRTVPLWYIAPVFMGLTLRALPDGGSGFVWFSQFMVGLIAIYGFLIWLNLRAAASVEKDAVLYSTRSRPDG